MKKVIFVMLFLVLVGTLVLAQGQGGTQGEGVGVDESGQQGEDQGTGQGQQVQTGQQTQNQGEEQNIMIQQRQQVKAQTSEELGQMIQQRQQEMNQETQGMGKQEQKVYQNQNQVRLAVHTLLAMEDLVGGIGQNVSRIAREFNNSVQATIRAEEKIQTRSGLARFFLGGDEEAAQELEQETNQSQLRIQELKQLMEECECDEGVRAMMQEQIQNMEQEQTRLQELTQNEKKSKGLFGWLLK